MKLKSIRYYFTTTSSNDHFKNRKKENSKNRSLYQSKILESSNHGTLSFFFLIVVSTVVTRIDIIYPFPQFSLQQFGFASAQRSSPSLSLSSWIKPSCFLLHHSFQISSTKRKNPSVFQSTRKYIQRRRSIGQGCNSKRKQRARLFAHKFQSTPQKKGRKNENEDSNEDGILIQDSHEPKREEDDKMSSSFAEPKNTHFRNNMNLFFQKDQFSSLVESEKTRLSSSTVSHSEKSNNLIGIIIPLGVILSLAFPRTQPSISSEAFLDLPAMLLDLPGIPSDVKEALTDIMGGMKSSMEIPNEILTDVEMISSTVVEAVVPADAVDVFSIALGEGIAGFIGALATFLVGMTWKMNEPNQQTKRDTLKRSIQTKENQNDEWGQLEVSQVEKEFFDTIEEEFVADKDVKERMVQELVTEAVADSDYFLTKSAARNLFTAAGIPPAAAELVSVILAIVPYQFVKLSAKKRQLRDEEDRFMEALLLENRSQNEDEQKKSLSTGLDIVRRFSSQANQEEKSDATMSATRTSMEKEPVVVVHDNKPSFIPGNVNQIDFVELFADLLKWLEYDVLDSDYSGEIQWNDESLNPGLESAIFGVIAAVSSGLYADIIYRSTNFGLEKNRVESRTRTNQGWISKYLRDAVSTATLFGVYSAARSPIQAFLSQLLSGGIEGCTGSKDFSLCMETYLTSNPAMASKDAEIRSFLVALSSLLDRLRLDIDDSNVGFIELGRSLSVQFYSLITNYFSA